MADKKSTKSSPSETIEKDQDDLMSTLESIRGLLEQSEGKLNAARESISIANTNTQNDTSALYHLRNNDEEIVPILDEIVEPDIILEEPVSLANLETADIEANELPEAELEISEEEIPELEIPELEIPELEIPELDSIVLSTDKLSDSSIVLDSDLALPVSDNDAIPEAGIGTSANEIKPANDLASLTQKNLLIDAIDHLQADLEESLREQLMKTMVSLEKDLKDKIAKKIEQIKSEILD